MKDTDYRNIKGILDTIDSLTLSADEFKKMQEEIKDSEVRAKLSLNINGQTREIILSKKITELTLSESIKSCNDSVKELKEGIDKILDEYLDCIDKESENKGKLLKLPCAVGDTVYAYCNEFGVLGYTVDCIVIDKNITFQCSSYSEPIGDCPSECLDEIEPDILDFGKTVFLTPEEAEAALKNM